MLARRAALFATTALGVVILGSVASSCVLLAEIDYDLIRDTEADAGSQSSSTGMPECTSSEACDDGNACTEDMCELGKCLYTQRPEGSSCGTPASFCKYTLACSADATCETQVVVILDDDPCTKDSCDATTGEVSHTPLGGGCVSWVPLPTTGAPSNRYNHSAVWTGSKMLIWGGDANGPNPLGDGAMYDPQTGTWEPMTMTGAPAARFGHSAVWTGTKMIIWGGYAASGFVGSGAAFDPASNVWTPLSKTSEPKARIQHTAIWTGSQMVVWGGSNNGIALNTGGVYDPATDKWTATPSGGLSPRAQHSAVFAGTRMIVWGGGDFFDWLSNGALLEMPQNTWLGATSTTNAPSFREAHTVVWTGSRMIVWGGWNGGPFLDTGGMFDPSTSTQGSWTAISTQDAPSARRDHIAVWTGSSMLVWGGCGGDLCTTLLGDGGKLDPGTGVGGTWTKIPEGPTLSPRRGPTAVFTGSRVIVWGGRDAQGPLGTGAEALP